MKEVGAAREEKVIEKDGLKCLLPDRNWLLIEAWGTELVLRAYAEAMGPGRMGELRDVARDKCFPFVSGEEEPKIAV